MIRKTIFTTFRLYLAFYFFIYGAIKVFPGQFPKGDFVLDSTMHTPMQLAWYFFGFSDGYNLFIAAGELIAAVLLTIPRTVTVGNLIVLPITINITVIDYFFDIPALGFSLLLSCMSVALLLMEYKKLLPLLSSAKKFSSKGA